MLSERIPYVLDADLHFLRNGLSAVPQEGKRWSPQKMALPFRTDAKRYDKRSCKTDFRP